MAMLNKAAASLFAGFLLITAGCASTPYQTSASESSDTQAKKLGTQWGEDIDSSIVTVTASRLTQQPYRTMSLYYRGEAFPKQLKKQYQIDLSPIEFSVLNERNSKMPYYREKANSYVLPAQEGQRYQLSFTNNSQQKIFEVVATVDGLDVLTGQKGSYQQNGYLVRPGTTLVIDGFRKSDEQVAAFRFAAPEQSYAAQNLQGDIDNTGVIGVALFEVTEQGEALPDCQPQAFPANSQYAPAPCKK